MKREEVRSKTQEARELIRTTVGKEYSYASFEQVIYRKCHKCNRKKEGIEMMVVYKDCSVCFADVCNDCKSVLIKEEPKK